MSGQLLCTSEKHLRYNEGKAQERTLAPVGGVSYLCLILIDNSVVIETTFKFMFSGLMSIDRQCFIQTTLGGGRFPPLRFKFPPLA